MKLPILTYHSIDRSGSVISTVPEIFGRQMKFLHENDFRVITLSEAIENFAAGKSLAPKTITLTFDDGFRNFYTEAFPILEKYDFPATVFLVTDFCGSNNDWAGNPPDLPRTKLLAWNEIKTLSANGIEFGAHTRTHPDLTRISVANAKREITESKAIIETKLGKPALTFAYPYGRYNAEVKHLVEANFAAACSVKLGKAQLRNDFFALERIDCYYLQNPRVFNLLSSKKIDFYLQTRRTLRDLKARFAHE